MPCVGDGVRPGLVLLYHDDITGERTCSCRLGGSSSRMAAPEFPGRKTCREKSRIRSSSGESCSACFNNKRHVPNLLHARPSQFMLLYSPDSARHASSSPGAGCVSIAVATPRAAAAVSQTACTPEGCRSVHDHGGEGRGFNKPTRNCRVKRMKPKISERVPQAAPFERALTSENLCFLAGQAQLRRRLACNTCRKHKKGLSFREVFWPQQLTITNQLRRVSDHGECAE